MEAGITTREATRMVRLQQWTQVFRDRAASGMSIAEYCRERGISRDKYFYWLKLAREAAFDAGNIAFVELPQPAETEELTAKASETVIRIGNATIEIRDSISDALLSRIIKAVKDA